MIINRITTILSFVIKNNIDILDFSCYNVLKSQDNKQSIALRSTTST
jgi:hypothetical protein